MVSDFQSVTSKPFLLVMWLIFIALSYLNKNIFLMLPKLENVCVFFEQVYKFVGNDWSHSCLTDKIAAANPPILFTSISEINYELIMKISQYTSAFYCKENRYEDLDLSQCLSSRYDEIFFSSLSCKSLLTFMECRWPFGIYFYYHEIKNLVAIIFFYKVKRFPFLLVHLSININFIAHHSYIHGHKNSHCFSNF